METRLSRIVVWVPLGVVVLLATISEAVNIERPPVITLQPSSKGEIIFQVASGTDEEVKPLVLECEAEGEPTPTYRWEKNGELFNSHSDDRISKQSGTGTITFPSPRSEDQGSYQCFASNGHGTASSNLVSVREYKLDDFENEDPIVLRVHEGDSANLECMPPDGYPKPHISWVIQDDSGTVRSISSSRMTVDPYGTLWFSHVKRFDQSNDFVYACSATSTFEYKLGSRVILRVLQKDNTTVQPENEPNWQFLSAKNTVLLKGETLKLWCIFSGIPNPEMKWKKFDNSEQVDLPFDRVDYENGGKTLVIYYADFEDEGRYECVADNGVGDAKSYSMNVVVEGVPEPPVLLSVVCNSRDATINWRPSNDNRSPIIAYIIQYNTSFTPDTWENAFDSVPAYSTAFTVSLSPWVNYAFRVIARNKVGQSLPYSHSDICSTPPNVPYKNPDGVEGRGTTPHNLVIRWTPMPRIEHNAPGFKYRVHYKRDDIADDVWQTVDVFDWEQDHYVIPNQPTFKPYHIKVEAVNDMGKALESAFEVRGWSGEDVPIEAPLHLTLLDLIDGNSAKLTWDPVSEASVRGHFRGYKIRTWAENEEEDEARDIIVENGSETIALVRSFTPYTRNFVRVLVFNGAYDGPPSDLISFVTPEGKPGPVHSLQAIPMGSSGLFLVWNKPRSPNGILIGYHIYYQEVQGIRIGNSFELDPPIRDPSITRVKLPGLKPATKYRITIRARTAVGQGTPYFIEHETQSNGAIPPGKPTFIWQYSNTTGVPVLDVWWIPNTENSGSHFFVKYKRYGDSIFQETKPELYQDSISLKDLEGDTIYLIRVVSVDGPYTTESDEEEIRTL